MLQKVFEVSRAYDEIESRIQSVISKTGNSCPDRCGICCSMQKVEATPLECFPIAYRWIREGREEAIHNLLQDATNRGSRQCIAYLPDPEDPARGRCGAYEDRPLLCRLFGFTANRNKIGIVRFSPCRVAREAEPETTARISMALLSISDPPIYQDLFQRVAGIDPNHGYRLMSINEAIQEAMEILYWHTPTDEISEQIG